MTGAEILIKRKKRWGGVEDDRREFEAVRKRMKAEAGTGDCERG